MIEYEPWPLYAETRDRLIIIVRSLTDEQASETVPLTPGWTIAEVVAHVCGLNADVIDGAREGLGTDERTENQVRTRAGLSIAEVCEEWLGHSAAIQAIIDANGMLGLRLAADLAVHLQDVQHALGLPIDPDDAASISGGRIYAARICDRLLELTGTAVTIELTDGSTFAPTEEQLPDTPSLLLRASPYDVLRSVTGRRSRAEVERLDWSDDPGKILDHLSPYGPLRTTDAEI